MESFVEQDDILHFDGLTCMGWYVLFDDKSVCANATNTLRSGWTIHVCSIDVSWSFVTFRSNPWIIHRAGDVNSVMFGWFFASSFLIAVDRFCVFAVPSVATVVFDNRKRMWAIAVFVPLFSGRRFLLNFKLLRNEIQFCKVWCPGTHAGCPLNFDHNNLHWYYDCSEDAATGFGGWWLKSGNIYHHNYRKVVVRARMGSTHSQWRHCGSLLVGRSFSVESSLFLQNPCFSCQVHFRKSCHPLKRRLKHSARSWYKDLSSGSRSCSKRALSGQCKQDTRMFWAGWHP